MNKNYKAKLQINKKDTEMNPFVESFVASTTIGMVSSLKGVEFLKSIDVTMNHGEVHIKINSTDIPLTPFPNDIIANTISGMAGTLKGGDEIKSIDIHVDVS